MKRLLLPLCAALLISATPLQSRAQTGEGPNEGALWELFKEGRYRELENTIDRLHAAYPDWQPPPDLLQTLQQTRYGEIEQELWRLLEEHDHLRFDETLRSHRQAHPAWQPPPEMLEIREQREITAGEGRLWKLLGEQRHGVLRREMAQMRERHPQWQPPADLLRQLGEFEQASKIRRAIDTADAPRLITLAARHPGRFTCARVDRIWALSDAYRKQGRDDRARTLDLHVIENCPKAQDRLVSLQRLQSDLDAPAFNDLLDAELRRQQPESVRQQLEELRYRQQLSRVAALNDAAEYAEARKLLMRIEDEIRGHGELDDTLLAGWTHLNAGAPEAAARHFEWAARHHPESDDARFGLALALFRQQRLANAADVLRQSRPLPPEHQRLLGDILLAQADERYASGDYPAALALLDEAEQLGGNRHEIAARRGWCHFRLARFAQAEEAFALAYAEQPDAAVAEGLVLSRHRLGRLMTGSPAADGPLRDVEQAFVARRLFERDLFLAAAAAGDARPPLQEITSPRLSAGVQWRDKSRGESGLSNLRITALPLLSAEYSPRDDLRLQLDLRRLDLKSGDADADALIGQALSRPPAWDHPRNTHVKGAWEPRLSFVQEGWTSLYGSIGLTPDEGAVHSRMTGSLGMLQQTRNGHWRAELFAAPVRESILSYTGLRDPWSGDSFGGVRRFGLRLSGYQAVADAWGLSAYAEHDWLRGERVRDNSAVRLGLFAGRSLAREGYDYLTVGPELAFEAYDHNLNHFTLGHGGYFSPSRRTNLGITANLQSEEGAELLFRARAHAGFYAQHEAASPCFPLDGTAPAESICQGYSGDSESGPAINLSASVVRRISNEFQLGLATEYRWTDSYEDTALMLLLSWQPGARHGSLSRDLPDALLQQLF